MSDEATDMAVEAPASEAPASEDAAAPVGVLDQPAVTTGKRARKTVEKVVVEEIKEKAELVIPEGSGTPLGDIENVNFHLDKNKADGHHMRLLHQLCFGTIGKKTVLKKNLRQFNGLVYKDDAAKDKIRAKLDKEQNASLKLLLTICDQELSGKKDDMVDR